MPQVELQASHRQGILQAACQHSKQHASTAKVMAQPVDGAAGAGMDGLACARTRRWLQEPGMMRHRAGVSTGAWC